MKSKMETLRESCGERGSEEETYWGVELEDWGIGESETDKDWRASEGVCSISASHRHKWSVDLEEMNTLRRHSD